MALGLVVSEVERERDEETVDDALALFGLYAVRPETQVIEVYLWPENLQSWNLFQELSTQWVWGPDGKKGISYPSIEFVMKMAGIKKRQRQRVYRDIQAMEWATLSAWNEKNE